MPHRTATISPKTVPGGLRSGKHRPDMPVMLGILEVFVDSARKLRRPNPLARRMDPWIKLSLGRESHATFIDKKGGRQPVFGQYFSFTVFAHTRILRVDCYDKSRIGSDLMIGYGAIELDAYLPAVNCGTQWFNLVHGGIRHAGQIQMHMAFYPKDASKLGKIHPPRLALTPICVNWGAIVKQVQETEKLALVAVAPVAAAAVRIVSKDDADEVMADSFVNIPRCASPVRKDSDSAIVSSRRNSTSSIYSPVAARRQPAAPLPRFSSDLVQSKLGQTAQAFDATVFPLAAHLTTTAKSSCQGSDIDSVYSLTTNSTTADTNGFHRSMHEEPCVVSRPATSVPKHRGAAAMRHGGRSATRVLLSSAPLMQCHAQEQVWREPRRRQGRRDRDRLKKWSSDGDMIGFEGLRTLSHVVCMNVSADLASNYEVKVQNQVPRCVRQGPVCPTEPTRRS